MSFEKELRRHIRTDVEKTETITVDKIVELIQSRYSVSELRKETVFDLFFKEVPTMPSDFKIREKEGRLEAILKKPAASYQVTGPQSGVFRREEITDINRIRSYLGIDSVKTVDELLVNLNKTPGRAFILTQERTLVYIPGTEISLDVLSYHIPTNARVPPMRRALGKRIHTQRIYEAEAVPPDPDLQLMYFVTDMLVDKGVLGNPCVETKEQIGRRVLAQYYSRS